MFIDVSHNLIQDIGLFGEDYLPSYLFGREDQINELAFCLAPAIRNEKPINVWIYGKPGTGKTATCKFIIRKLNNEHNVQSVYINCWENPSFYSVLDKIIREFKILGAEKLNSAFKFERIQKHLKGRSIILFFDEIDQFPAKEKDRILYNFCNLDKAGIVAICNSKYSIYNLDSRIRSRLNARCIEFQPYSKAELYSILEHRADFGLKNSCYTKSTLKEIVQLAENDARVAIQTLKNAAYIAEKELSNTIKSIHIKRGYTSAKNIKKTFLLNKLTRHHKILYDIVKDSGEILSGKLWAKYLKRCAHLKLKPIAARTYSQYLKTLIEIDLIKFERAMVRGKVRKFKAAQ